MLLPYSLYKGETEIRKPGVKVKFLVTGSINEISRDHMGLLAAFEKLWQTGRQDIGLTILGVPPKVKLGGQKVVEFMERLKRQG